MTGMERFQALMKGEIPDRVPVVCNLFEQGADELGIGIEEYYSRGEYVAEGQLKLREKYGYDVLWGYFFVAKITELFGAGRMVYYNNGPPNAGNMVIKSYDDIGKLEVPVNISDHPSFHELSRCIKILKQESGGKYPVLTATVSSFTLPSLLMGMDMWLNLMMTGPADLLNLMLEKTLQFCTGYIKALRDAGSDMVVYVSPGASLDSITEKQFNSLALPLIKREIEAVGPDDIIFFNGGGRINPIIEPLINETGIRVYYINPLDNIAEAKKIIAGRGISTGIINDIKLINWGREEIENEVKRIMGEGASGGRFIFGTLVMPYMIPEENIRIMLETAYKYGEYKSPAAGN